MTTYLGESVSTGDLQERLIYSNALASEADTAAFVLEGDGAVGFPLGRMRLESVRDPEEGQAANIVLWCDTVFPPDVVIRWDFWPIREPGLAILFFAATGSSGQDIFDPSLARRTGPYPQYHSSDINAYHVSYFRRRAAERAFHVSNLRKSAGFHLVASGADPIPGVADAVPPYHMEVRHHENRVTFLINDLVIFDWLDTGTHGGPPLTGGGRIGFRQMAPFIGEYANLTVHELT